MRTEEWHVEVPGEPAVPDDVLRLAVAGFLLALGRTVEMSPTPASGGSRPWQAHPEGLLRFEEGDGGVEEAQGAGLRLRQ